MKHLLRTLSLFLFLAPLVTKATHIVGGALTYVHNGGSSYTFTLKLYRDCGPGNNAYPNSVTIDVRGYNGMAFTPSLDFTMPGGAITMIPSNLDSCAVPPNPMPCVQERIYTSTVNLPANPGGYHLYYQVCCRNLSISNTNTSCNCVGGSMYAYIPGATVHWFEDFTLANNTTVDNGATAWSITTGTVAPNTASVNTNRFQTTGEDNAEVTWTSQSINTSALTAGFNLSVDLSEAGTIDAADSLITSYSLNGGPFIQFTTNGLILDDFGTATASQTALTANTVRIRVRARFNNNSPNSEIYRWDNVVVSANDHQNNSNPTFTNFPPLFLCAGDPINFNHVANDVDGDSLVYSLYTPYTDAAPTFASNFASFTGVTWNSGFSATNPLGGSGLTINPSTGVLTGTPNTPGQYVVGVKVIEYRNGIALSEMTRDFQFNVVNCPVPAQAIINSSGVVNACSGLSVQFPNNSTVTATNWWWNFGDGSTLADTSVAQFPTYAYPAPGTYTATLIINKGTPCADTATASVFVGFVNASFTTNSPQCPGSNVTFTNTTTTSSNATITGWAWDFTDGNTATTQNTSHAFAAGGTYNVSLIASSNIGCIDTAIVPVTIHTLPTSVASNNGPVCTGGTLNLSAANFPGATYSWSGPGGFTSSLQNPVITNITAAQAGVYTVVPTANGCTGTPSSTTVVVNTTPAAPVLSSNSPLCQGATLNLSATAPAGATYAWTGPASFSSTLPNPSIVGVTSANAGTYSATVTLNGCTSPVATTAVTVSPIPAAPTAGSNSPLCELATLNLSASNIAGATYNWTGPNSFTSTLQNPSIASIMATEAGTYSVTATVNGCTGPAGTVNVTVNPAPAAPVVSSNTPVCAGTSINLTATSASGATFNWSGPNSFSSTQQNPVIPNATTAHAGTYSVIATVSGCPGPAATTSVTVNPTPATPTASSNSPVCAGTTLNLSTPAVAGATYSWVGPGGFTSSLQNPSINGVSTAESGTYNVTITVAGCTSTAGSTTVTVNPIPVAPAISSNSPICAGSNLTLSTPAVTGATYNWTGPNSFGSSLQNPVITNATTAASGTYQLSILVNGCGSATASHLVTVHPIPATPVASSNSPVCSGNAVNLAASTISGATYAWVGPNSFSSTQQNPSIGSATTAATGIYSVTATVNGCTSPAGTTSVTVHPTPATPAPSSNGPVCVGNNLNLTTTAVAGASYSWNGPNAFSSTVQNPVIAGVTTAASGTYSLVITVNGCPSLAGTHAVVVNPIPAAPGASSNSPVCSNSTLNLNAGAIAGATYSWNGPNGFTSNLQNPVINNIPLAGAGLYQVTATVNGCPSPSSGTTVTVNPTPATPVVTHNGPLCAGGNLVLQTAAVPGATYLWSGPNGFSATTQNASLNGVLVADAGTYSVVVTANGCPSQPGTASIVVNPVPATPVPSGDIHLCDGDSLLLFASTIPGATYGWTGPNSFSSNQQNPVIFPVNMSSGGSYIVVATVNGCSSAPATIIPHVHPIPAPPTITTNSPICSGSTLTLNASFINDATYNWSGPNGFTDTLQNTSVSNATTTASGTYSVTINVEGCESPAANASVTINQTPAVPTAGANSPLCTGATLNLSATSTAGATFTWTGPSGFNSTSANPSITSITTANAGDYIVTATQNGCTSAADTITVVVNTAPPSPVVSSNSPVCSGDTIQLNSTLIAGAIYSWSGPNGFTSALQNPFITPAVTANAGTYNLVVNNGCASVPVSLSVVVNSTPAAPVVSVNSPVCNGGTANFTTPVVSGATYAWNGPSGFSASTQNPSLTPVSLTSAGAYTLTLTVNGCTGPAGTATLVVNDTVTTNAGTDVTVCANNAAVTLNGSVSGGSTTGTWSSSGTGTFPSGTSALNGIYLSSAADTAAGTITLTLTSTNNGACAADVDQMVVTITDAPVANAGPNVSICANNASVTLAGSVAIATGGTWTTTGTGTFSPNNTTLNATYTASPADTVNGSVTFSLITTGNGTCLADTDQVVVTITPSPVVNAGTDQVVCLSSPATSLSGTVAGGGGTGIWSSLGSGGFSPAATNLNATYNPSNADTAAGSVLLVLTSTNNGGCSAVTDTIKISFRPIPVVEAGANQTVCANNALVTLNGSVTVGDTSGIWTSSGTGTFSPSASVLNPTYQPDSADIANGSVTLILTSQNGCIQVADSMVISITPPPVANAGVDQVVCSNNFVTNLNGAVTGASSTGIWSTTGDGTFTPSNTALSGTYTPGSGDTAAGSVVLLLISTNNGSCLADTDAVIINIIDPAQVNAGANATFCANDTLQLNGQVLLGSGTGSWSTSGTGTFIPSASTLNAMYLPSAADTSAGTVTLVLQSTNNGNCLPSSDTMTATITPAPLAFAGVNQVVCGDTLPINISGTVSVATGGLWSSSGSGTFANATQLATTYTPSLSDVSAGFVQLFLTTTGNGLCNPVTDTMVLSLTPPVVVNAGVDTFICTGMTSVTLNGQVSGGATSGTWSTITGGTFNPNATTLNATYNLSAADITNGSFNLVLTSTIGSTCPQKTDTVLVTITPVPNTDAGTVSPVCASSPSVILAGTLFGGSGTAAWSTSGDGTFSPSVNDLNATYNPGPNDIANGSAWLYLTPVNSCSPLPDSVEVIIDPLPVANAGTDITICEDNDFSLNGSITGASGGVWTTNGSGTFMPHDSLLNATYVPATSDTGLTQLYVVLTSTGNGVCAATTDTVLLNFAPKPVADFSSATFCQGVSGQLTDLTTITGDTIQQWIWTYGNDTSFLQNPAPIFGSAGTQAITLVIISGEGCSDTITRNVTVNASPDASFTYSTFCGTDSVQFSDASTISGGTIATWNWNFGDALMSTDQNPGHTYSSASDYVVTLTVTSDSGCEQSVTDTIQMNQQAIASFDALPGCNNDVQLISTATFGADSIVSTSWAFGNGKTGTGDSLTHQYTSTGSYNVTLTVVTQSGCSATVTQQVDVSNGIVADFTPAGGSYFPGVPVSFTSGANGGTTWSWDFGDGEFSDTENPFHTFSSAGTYTVTMIVSSAAGCADTLSYEFVVEGGVTGLPSAFTPNGDGLNDVLYVRGGPFSAFDFRVFNEWGQQVFQGTEAARGWDGTINGNPQPAGTFIYTLRATTTAGTEINMSGDVTLLR